MDFFMCNETFCLNLCMTSPGGGSYQPSPKEKLEQRGKKRRAVVRSSGEKKGVVKGEKFVR